MYVIFSRPGTKQVLQIMHDLLIINPEFLSGKSISKRFNGIQARR
jgi:hypothetical protein